MSSTCQTAASDILGYTYVGISSTRSTLKKCTVFSSILVFIHFKLLLECCRTWGVYLEAYQTSMMQKRSVIDIWQGSKYDCATSFFKYLTLSSFGYLNKYMNILFFFWKRATTLLTWRKSNIYIYTIEMSRWNARLIYTINKNNKNNNKKQDSITKTSEKFLL